MSACVEQEISSPGTAARTAATTGSSTSAAIESRPPGRCGWKCTEAAPAAWQARASATICSSATGTAGWSAPVYASFIAHWIIGPSPSQVAVAEPRGREREQRGGHGTEHREVPGVDAVAQRLVALVVVEQGQV